MYLLLSDPVTLSTALIGIILLLVYSFGTNTYDFWKKRGIPYIKPKYPYFGNLYEAGFGLKCNHVTQQEIYKHFKGQRFGGIFLFKKPILFIKDPTLVESVLIKDFTIFSKRTPTSDLKEPLSSHLLNLEGKEWKSLRQKLSPTFTSGKLKGMHPQLIECADLLVKYMGEYANTSEPFELREIIAKFTTDVIGSCAFGLNTNALNDPESAFRKLGKRIFKPSFITKLRASLRDYSPALLKLFKPFSVAGGVHKFFETVLTETMTFREKNNVVRNDFVQLLMELKEEEMEKKKNGLLEDDQIIIDDHVIASNAFVFFIAGFETTASTLSYCIYHLSMNEDIQEKAYQNAFSILKKYGGDVSYDAVKEMTYIHNIFTETLRMHPPVPEIKRISAKNYIIPETSIMIPKETTVLIPIYSLHFDPEHFPDPEEFKPERFEKKDKVKKGTYLPFSDGPRICIGERFAKMEMRVALVKLLLNYKFKLNSKTISPLVYNPSALLLAPIGGIWVDLEKRI